MMAFEPAAINLITPFLAWRGAAHGRLLIWQSLSRLECAGRPASVHVFSDGLSHTPSKHFQGFAASEAHTSSLSLRANTWRFAWTGGTQTMRLPKKMDVGSTKWARLSSSYPIPFWSQTRTDQIAFVREQPYGAAVRRQVDAGSRL